MVNHESSPYPTDVLASLAVGDANFDQSTLNLAWAIAQAADDRKAADIVILKVDEVSYLADYFVIITGFSSTQARAISEAIEDHVEQEFQKLPLHIAGKSEAAWILQDYGDVIVHIFQPQEREFYHLEAFWGHAQRIEFSPVNPLQP